MTTNTETAAAATTFFSGQIAFLQAQVAKAEAGLEGAIARDEASYQFRLSVHDYSGPWLVPTRSSLLENFAREEIRRAKEALQTAIEWRAAKNA